MKLVPCLELESIERSVLKVCDYIDKKKEQLEWHTYSEEQLWFELVSCILGSQVQYETAKGCIDHLAEHGLLDIQKILKEPDKIQDKISLELSKPIYPPFVGNRGSRYRYPNTKAKFIVRTCLELYNEESSLGLILERCSGAYEARDILIKKCMGIGPKQASLFLRNISYCKDLAIIDSHVVDYMKIMKLNEDIDSQRIANKNQYLMNEKILLSYADDREKTLASLDYAIWVVMRLIKREFVS